MNPRLCRFVGVFVLGSLLATTAFAQNQGPRLNVPPASPSSTVKQRVGFTDIEVVYARPGVKGRKIFGDFLPYGEVWRTGANSSTKITFSTDVTFGGQKVPAGSYALFTIPDAKEWTVILNKVTGEWGAYTYKQENDLVRVKAKVEKLTSPVETFTIDINDIRNESATLNLEWENTRVTVPLGFETHAKVIAQIDELMKSGQTLSPMVYFQAATFYFDNNLGLEKAKTWINEATKGENPQFFMLHWKAKILAKSGDKAGAKAAANASIAAAEKAGGAAAAEYKRLNENLLKTL